MRELSRKGITVIVFDFDGVFTDGKVTVSQDGTESVVCSRKDSLGINLLKEKRIRSVVISKEKNPVVMKRCEKMGIDAIAYYFMDDLKSGVDPALYFAKELKRRDVKNGKRKRIKRRPRDNKISEKADGRCKIEGIF